MFLELRASRSVSLSMSDTEVLSHKGAIAIRVVTAIDLLGGVLTGQYGTAGR